MKKTLLFITLLLTFLIFNQRITNAKVELIPLDNTGKYLVVNENIEQKRILTLKEEIEYYGDSGFPISFTELVEFYLAELDNSKLIISKPIKLYDYNDILASYGYNIYYGDEFKTSIVISTHLRAPLIKAHYETPIKEDAIKSYFLDSNNLYYLTNQDYIDQFNNNRLDYSEFREMKNKLKTKFENSLTNDKLAEIERENRIILNNLLSLKNALENEDLFVKKDYDGQVPKAYGYGGIEDVGKYIKDRYGSGYKLSSERQLINVPSFKNSIYASDTVGGHCSIAAITRVLSYYYKLGYSNIDSKTDTVFSTVIAYAKQKGYWSKKDGTDPRDIDDIFEGVLKSKYNYKNSDATNTYIYSFASEVKDEINKSHPVLLNLSSGYYGSHTVTIIGYKEYKKTSGWLIKTTTTRQFIMVYDGWDSSIRYIDYDAMTNPFSGDFTLASFSKVTVKK
jgi:hypothetical protein